MDVRNDVAFEAYKQATGVRDHCEMEWQKLLAQYEEADVRFLGGDPNAFNDKMAVQENLAASRVPHEIARRRNHNAWAEWAHRHHATTNELLADIRDLLIKMANPPIMVSLDSTPESRAANLVKRIEAIAESDPVFAERPTEENEIVRNLAEGLKSDAAIIDRAVYGGKAARAPALGPKDVEQLRQIAEGAPVDAGDLINKAAKRSLCDLGLVLPKYGEDGKFIGYVLTNLGREWAACAGFIRTSATEAGS